MKNKIISTPLKWYLYGTLCLLLFLVLWIVFSFTKGNCGEIISDFSKNSFFAIFGSLAVSFLIDVGNTARENEVKENSFLQLKGSIETIYSIISGISFVLDQSIEYDEKEYKVTLKNFYNNEFYYSKNNSIEFTNLHNISVFKKKIEPHINKLVLSNSFVHLDTELAKDLEALYIDNFYLIGCLGDAVNSSIIGLPKDIEHLSKITATIARSLGKNDHFEMLSEEEAKKQHDKRIELTQSFYGKELK